MLCNDHKDRDILIQNKYPEYLSKFNIMFEIQTSRFVTNRKFDEDLHFKPNNLRKNQWEYILLDYKCFLLYMSYIDPYSNL